MTMKEYETLKVGDIVTQVHGKNKGQPAKVTHIWDHTDSDGYREILIDAVYLDPSLHNPNLFSDVDCNYRHLRRIYDKGE